MEKEGGQICAAGIQICYYFDDDRKDESDDVKDFGGSQGTCGSAGCHELRNLRVDS